MGTGQRTEVATLGGGCFWCLDGVYRELLGVESVVSGYAGGHVPDPSYEQVCRGDSGHAEVVRVTFDPDVLSYRRVLEIFFAVHDPTTLDRQGADVGSQYRSVIFHHSAEQKATAEAIMSELREAGVWDDPIVTRLEPAPEFYPAEEAHQDFYRRNPGQPYCQIVIAPKLGKFRKQFLGAG